MNNKLWVISGATSIIAKEFAHLAATKGANLLLLGRDAAQLAIICADLRCRYATNCAYITQDFSQDMTALLSSLNALPSYNLFLGHSDGIVNNHLNQATITRSISTNIESNVQLLHAYWQAPFPHKNIIFISSVAANMGRNKNSLYGAGKAAIEIYLQGLQQSCTATQHILIARAGFIDTQQTYGLPGVFYAAPARAFAARLWQSQRRRHYRIYFPRFWRAIMMVFSLLPWPIYKRVNKL